MNKNKSSLFCKGVKYCKNYYACAAFLWRATDFFKKRLDKYYKYLIGISRICIIFIMSYIFCGYCFAETAATEFTYDAHDKKDPFSPPVVSMPEKESSDAIAGLQVEGIIWDKEKPIAIINDKVVGVGDEINGAKVVEINQNEVVFDVNGQKISKKLITKTE